MKTKKYIKIIFTSTILSIAITGCNGASNYTDSNNHNTSGGGGNNSGGDRLANFSTVLNGSNINSPLILTSSKSLLSKTFGNQEENYTPPEANPNDPICVYSDDNVNKENISISINDTNNFKISSLNNPSPSQCATETAAGKLIASYMLHFAPKIKKDIYPETITTTYKVGSTSKTQTNLIDATITKSDIAVPNQVVETTEPDAVSIEVTNSITDNLGERLEYMPPVNSPCKGTYPCTETINLEKEKLDNAIIPGLHFGTNEIPISTISKIIGEKNNDQNDNNISITVKIRRYFAFSTDHGQIFQKRISTYGNSKWYIAPGSQKQDSDDLIKINKIIVERPYKTTNKISFDKSFALAQGMLWGTTKNNKTPVSINNYFLPVSLTKQNMVGEGYTRESNMGNNTIISTYFPGNYKDSGVGVELLKDDDFGLPKIHLYIGVDGIDDKSKERTEQTVINNPVEIHDSSNLRLTSGNTISIAYKQNIYSGLLSSYSENSDTGLFQSTIYPVLSFVGTDNTPTETLVTQYPETFHFSMQTRLLPFTRHSYVNKFPNFGENAPQHLLAYITNKGGEEKLETLQASTEQGYQPIINEYKISGEKISDPENLSKIACGEFNDSNHEKDNRCYFIFYNATTPGVKVQPFVMKKDTIELKAATTIADDIIPKHIAFDGISGTLIISDSSQKLLEYTPVENNENIKYANAVNIPNPEGMTGGSKITGIYNF